MDPTKHQQVFEARGRAYFFFAGGKPNKATILSVPPFEATAQIHEADYNPTAFLFVCSNQVLVEILRGICPV